MDKGDKGKQVRGEREYWGWHKEGGRFDAFWGQSFQRTARAKAVG